MRPENDSLVRAALAEPGAHLEYRWVTSSDSEAVSGSGVHFDPRSHRWLVLSDSVAFAGSDADTVEVHSSTHGSTVSLKLNMDAGARLLSTTDSHVGDQLAVLLNGHLLVSPPPEIRGPLAGTVPVVTDVDAAVAADLAARLRGPSDR